MYHITFCLFISRYAQAIKVTVVMKISLINKNLNHLVNNIFWDMGFKNDTQAEKVIIIIHNILIISIQSIITFVLLQS